MNREICIDCQNEFDRLVKEKWLEEALECYTNDLFLAMCLKCVSRIINKYDKPWKK